MRRHDGRLRSERGAALFAAAVGMLLLAILAISFGLLGNLEVRIALNQREAVQAFDLAAAGLEHGRDFLRAAAATGNFDTVLTTSFTGSGTDATRGTVLTGGGVTLTGQTGTYHARIDNNCGTNVKGAGVANDPGCASGAAGNDADATVIVTAWATAGNGRARVRQWVTMSDPWKHTCYNGDMTLCVDEPAANPNATLVPGDPCPERATGPSHPNGPCTGPLPVPNSFECGAQILTPPGITFAETECVIQPYYDAALQTACTVAMGCVAASQSSACAVGAVGKVLGLPPNGSGGTNNGKCVGAPQASGLVFYGPSGTILNGAHVEIKSSGGGKTFTCAGDHLNSEAVNVSMYNTPSLSPAHPAITDGDPTTATGLTNGSYACAGAANTGVTVYVMGDVRIGNGGVVNGTLVLHGNNSPGTTGPNVDFEFTGQGAIFTVPEPTPYCDTPNCGYPLSILVYDTNPSQHPAPPTGQNTFVNISNSNTVINGIVFSAGEVSFNPITVWGGVVAYKSYFQNASSDVTYVASFGSAAPPPGFSTPTGTSMASVSRNTFQHCKTFVDQATQPTSCD